jgi:hypothetical protein
MNKEETLKRAKKNIERSRELLKELRAVPFSILNPRFWKIKKELDKSIKSFNLEDCENGDCIYKKENKERCENCYWYRWEDSVWGYCWRFPPKIIKKRKYFWQPEKIEQTKPEVYCDTIACGEFKEKNYEK